MSDAEPMLLPEEWLASLESLMSTLLLTSQTTTATLLHILALVDSTLLMASNSAAPTVVQMSPSMAQAAATAIPLPTDLSNLPAFLEAYKVQAATNAKAEIEGRLHPTVVSCLCPSLPPIYDGNSFRTGTSLSLSLQTSSMTQTKSLMPRWSSNCPLLPKWLQHQHVHQLIQVALESIPVLRRTLPCHEVPMRDRPPPSLMPQDHHYGSPNDTKVDEWFEATRPQDFLLHLEDDFVHHAAPAPTRPACVRVAPASSLWWQPPIPSLTMLCTVPQPPSCAPPTATAPPLALHSLPMGVPMDIDASCMQAATAEDMCRQCQKKGCFTQDCPLCWDVCHIFDKELDEFIMQLLTCQDA
ncbi:hypothetical protein DXG03_005385 [Asterophora parasitica]|uniref:Uncharacterized protein n=1 Tax=Asterophora parasitica TaxID=117018 RepID=A0A9P7K9R5_9AGAR|nr:hypothetical protein DXG03_005385 [Asterophora parasitica]